MEKYDLNEEQLKTFIKIRGNSYGEGGAFFGMCMNQALDSGKTFEEMLKINLDEQARINLTYNEGLKSTKKPVVEHEVIK